MLAFSDPLFWLYFFLFFVAVFFAFFIPGDLVTRKLSLLPFPRIITSTVVGMVLWGWQGIIFGYLGTRVASYLYIVISLILWLKISWKSKNTLYAYVKKPITMKINSNKNNIFLIALTIFGTIVQVTTVWFTGIISPGGLYFCCGNISDALFHASLTNQIIDHFPPYQPGMYGVIVHNYHYWSNLVIAELIRVFHLPLLATQYQYSSVFVSSFLGLTAIVFGNTLKLKKSFTVWLVFFLYFGGDLAYLILFIFGHGLNFNMTSLEDGTKFLINPPRAYSIIIFFTGLTLLTLWIKKKDFFTGILTSIALGSIIGFKVYTGIFSLVGLVALAIYFLCTKNIRMIVPLLMAPVLSLIIYIPVNAASGGLYFTGFWVFDNYIVNKDFGLQRWELARMIYQDHRSWLRVFQYEGMFAGLFFISTFGSKLLGLFQTKKSLSWLPKEIHIFLFSGIVISTLTGLFFQQTSGGANTFNFLVSVFLIGSIYTALTCYYLTERINKNFTVLFIVFIVLITAPRVIREWVENIKQVADKHGFMISNNELQAYKYLQDNTDTNALILVDTTNFSMSKDSPYVSLLTGRNIFLSGTGILASHGIDFKQREKVIKNILEISDPKLVKQVIAQNKIDYILMSANDKLRSETKNNQYKIVFKNKQMKILKPF